MSYLRRLFSSKIGNRSVNRSKFLYYYLIIGAVVGLMYFMASLIFELPKHWALTPFYVLITFTMFHFLRKNWTLIWMYISDMERGKLLLYINKTTHWSQEHKLKMVKWVYLGRGYVRAETKAKVSKKIYDSNRKDYSGDPVSVLDRIYAKRKGVVCPQQLKDGINEPMLVNALIYAHQNIHVLDDDLREIMHLSDGNIAKFDLNLELKKASGRHYEELVEIGKRNSQKNKN